LSMRLEKRKYAAPPAVEVETKTVRNSGNYLLDALFSGPHLVFAK
jgi:hypothetical protein